MLFRLLMLAAERPPTTWQDVVLFIAFMIFMLMMLLLC
jgi:hypothetical protein